MSSELLKKIGTKLQEKTLELIPGHTWFLSIPKFKDSEYLLSCTDFECLMSEPSLSLKYTLNENNKSWELKLTKPIPFEVSGTFSSEQDLLESSLQALSQYIQVVHQLNNCVKSCVTATKKQWQEFLRNNNVFDDAALKMISLNFLGRSIGTEVLVELAPENRQRMPSNLSLKIVSSCDAAGRLKLDIAYQFRNKFASMSYSAPAKKNPDFSKKLKSLLNTRLDFFESWLAEVLEP